MQDRRALITVLCLALVAGLVLYTQTPLAPTLADGAPAKQADETERQRIETQRERTRVAYMRQIEHVTAELTTLNAQLRRLLIEHPGSAADLQHELRAWQESRVALAIELIEAESDEAFYRELLEAGDADLPDTFTLKVEQSQRMIEIDRELRTLLMKRAALEAAARASEDGREPPEMDQIDEQLNALSRERAETFDRLARQFFNATQEASARRVEVLRDQLSEIEPRLAEIHARYEDYLRADASRASIEREIIAAERRRDALIDRLRDAELEADLQAASR